MEKLNNKHYILVYLTIRVDMIFINNMNIYYK